MKKKHSFHSISWRTTIVFIVFIFALTIVNLFSPNVSFSENENRTLADFPSLTLSNIFGGDFDDQFETWFSDHFVSRDTWIQTKASVRIAAGAIENNDVYLGSDGHLIGSFSTVNETTLNNNISYVNEFAQDNDINLNVMIVPTAAYGESQFLPYGAYNVDQKTLIEQIQKKMSSLNFIDLTDSLNNTDSYFKTDHHWNEKGAYTAYQAVCSSVLNKDPESFTYTAVSDDFKGTMYSKSGAFWTKGDTICRIDPVTENDITVTIDHSTVLHSLYVDDNLNGKDKYTYYLDGNHGYEQIETSVNNGKKAVIVKDSYAHILIPYLAQEYSEIDVVDLRYYRDAVSELITDKNDTDVYIIYSLDEFASDKNLAGLW